MMASALSVRLQVKCFVIRRSESQVAYEFHDTSALVNSRDLRVVPRAEIDHVQARRTSLGGRGELLSQGEVF
jgi:hypothetical protein